MNKNILLGMSGGVDSAVSAILLQKNGYNVIGANIKMINEENDDAKKLCQDLGIQFYSFDCKEMFQKYVIDDFICQYKNCNTPNPCIECNKYLKFGFLWEKAKELNCDFIATGHYAKKEFSEKYQKFVIKKSNNILKDQSYVLWNIFPKMLEHIIFPLEEFSSKDEIRKIAQENNLFVASKPDSEDICFIPDGNYKKFLEENSDIKSQEGNIVLKNGTILGKHHGLYNYTIGQRKGMGVAYKEPLFVVGFDKEKNELIVGTENEIYSNEMFVNQINWLAIEKLDTKMHVMCKTRYSNKEYPCNIEMIDEENLLVKFDNPVGRITPGQSAVFYDGDILLGGGKIVSGK